MKILFPASLLSREINNQTKKKTQQTLSQAEATVANLFVVYT